MKLRLLLAILLLSVGTTTLAIAQSSQGDYLPRLGDIMGATQWRHIKLWFAGKLLNWDLAAYELNQIKGSLVDAATLYPGIPITDVTTMAKPVQSISDAIEAKDSAKFARAFNELTAGCNSCHREIGGLSLPYKYLPSRLSATSYSRRQPNTKIAVAHIHSYRSASIGSRLAVFRAG